MIALTKVDKINQTGKSKNLELLKKELLQSWDELPLIFETSATKGTGKEQLMGFIEDTNKKVMQ